MAFVSKSPVKVPGLVEERKVYLKPWYVNKINFFAGTASILFGAWDNKEAAQNKVAVVVQAVKDKEGNDTGEMEEIFTVLPEPKEQPLFTLPVNVNVKDHPELLPLVSGAPMPMDKNAKKLLYEAASALPELANYQSDEK